MIHLFLLNSDRDSHSDFTHQSQRYIHIYIYQLSISLFYQCLGFLLYIQYIYINIKKKYLNLELWYQFNYYK